MSLISVGLLYFAYMTLLWQIGHRWQNAGWVDFGWTSGCVALAVFLSASGTGAPERRVLLGAMYCLCGGRLLLGWICRSIRDGEDRRWGLWRDRWRNGEGWLGITSIRINLFAFYHMQTVATLFVLIMPLVIACRDSHPRIRHGISNVCEGGVFPT